MAKASSRALWKAKLEGKQTGTRTVLPGEITVGRSFRGTLLGIDPSLRGTGLAILEFKPGDVPVLLHSETIRNARDVPVEYCLSAIFKRLCQLIEQYKLKTASLEETIYVQNYQTAMVLGAARGAILTALSLHHLSIYQYAPLRIKQAVVGVGRASKEQMARTVRGILRHGAQLAPDEADAAGAALCHAFTWKEET